MNVYSQIATQIFEIRINQNFSSPISRAKGCSKKFKKQIVFLGNLLKKGSEHVFASRLFRCVVDDKLNKREEKAWHRAGFPAPPLLRTCGDSSHSQMKKESWSPRVEHHCRRANRPRVWASVFSFDYSSSPGFTNLPSLSLHFHQHLWYPAPFALVFPTGDLKKKKKRSASSVSLDCCPPRSWGLSECHSEREQGAL